ncbi:MAG: tetratricopeptide repeat-containing sensor histidine kinase [Bacteroidota bacterium]
MRFLHKYLILISFVSFPFYILSQQAQTIDSLTKLLSTTTKDPIRIELFIKLCNEFEKEDSILKFAYADSALVLAENLQNIKFQAIAKTNKAKLFQLYNKYNEAITHYESSILLFNSIGNAYETASINFELGTVYYQLNNFQKSIAFHQLALKQRQNLKDTNGILESEKSVAVMFWRLGNLIAAEKHYMNALKISEKTYDTTSAGAVLNSLGAVHWGFGNYNKALKYYEKALKFALNTNNKKKYVLIINNIGIIYNEWGDNDKAIENYQEGLKVAKEENYAYGLAYSYNNMGGIYQLNKEFEKALLNFDSALVNYKKISKQIGIAFSYRHMGDTYLAMKNFSKAINYYQLSVKTAGEIDSKHHLAMALYSLANAYFENQNYNMAGVAANKSVLISINQNYKNISKDNYFLLSKLSELSGSSTEALIYYKKATSLKDSIFNEKSSNQIAEMQTRYETEKKERENIMLRKEEQLKNIQLNANKTKIQNQYIVIFAFAVFLVIVIIFAFLLNKRRRDLLKSKALLTKQNKEINIQKEELFAQRENLKETNTELKKATDFKNKMFSIIGHDLRGPIGTISSIVSLALEGKLSEDKKQLMLSSTKESAVAAFTLLENLLIWANNEQGIINYEPTNLKLFKIADNNIKLLKETADKKNIDVSVKIENNLEVFADYNTLETIFRNLISNAIKYSHKKGKIIISAKKNPDNIEISVTDTGIGMNSDEKKVILDAEKHHSNPGTGGEKGSGLGLQLCFEFIKMNKGDYHIVSEKGKGTCFIFTLPSGER